MRRERSPQAPPEAKKILRFQRFQTRPIFHSMIFYLTKSTTPHVLYTTTDVLSGARHNRTRIAAHSQANPHLTSGAPLRLRAYCRAARAPRCSGRRLRARAARAASAHVCGAAESAACMPFRAAASLSLCSQSLYWRRADQHISADDPAAHHITQRAATLAAPACFGT